ncbi:P-loop containing nucleoside triphosphate hydrolase protein [Penicillium hispanicum]|uniref:P-loop containing nucleoside triphosphate hydrolase protein n=1 Tax=Penicillium hispanicum TaxID=1080232 RepID=UPI00253F8D60|nr:P-loop containing nucleoside triphosphate hydrolase protein [Penicillium hispanicum]KAJ5584988.1 P-loop containing nucleoside triphosphate hydrolase protein [Penicillium hispanicum]
MGSAADQKSTLNCVIDFVLPLIHQHLQHRRLDKDHPNRPFFLAISGTQGSGKSTLASALCDVLRRQKPCLQVASVSIDDFYLKKDDLDDLSHAFPGNKLVSVRGPPGTHDVRLAAQTMEALAADPTSSGRPSVTIPRYDKSAFDGRGDRLPPSEWEVIQTPVDVVILEGWCLGFQRLPEDKLEEAIAEARRNGQADKPVGGPSGRAILLQHPPEHLCQMNEALRGYTPGLGVTAFTDKINWDAFIHLDTADLQNVYKWRWEQEAKLRAATGSGMSKEQVEKFSAFTPTQTSAPITP